MTGDPTVAGGQAFALRAARKSHESVFVSVIIPHFDDIDSLQRCLSCLRRQTFLAERFEVIIGENNSPCGIDVVRALAAGVTVVAAPIQGAGPARNAAIRTARGDIYAFIDSDCFAEPEWLENGVKALAETDFLGGRVITTVRDPSRPSISEAYEAVFAFDFEKYITKDGFTGTGNMFAWRDVFEAVGEFRAGVSEDVDWSRRATHLGYRLSYAPTVIVLHRARETWSQLMQKYRRFARESYFLARERRYGVIKFLLWSFVILVSPVYYFPRIVHSTAVVGFRPKLLSFAGLVGAKAYRCEEMWRFFLFRH